MINYLGYTKIKPSWKPSDEEGQCCCCINYYSFLHDVWLLRLCCIWQRCTRESANGLRFLWALLARGRGQRLHCATPSWSISSILHAMIFPILVKWAGPKAHVWSGLDWAGLGGPTYTGHGLSWVVSAHLISLIFLSFWQCWCSF